MLNEIADLNGIVARSRIQGWGKSMPHGDVLLYLLGDLVVIVLAARGFGAVARRFNQPAVIGEVLSGIVLGPTVLGRIMPSAPAWLFPPEVPLKAIADLGLVFFMFLVGLELDTHLMAQGRPPRVTNLVERRAHTVHSGRVAGDPPGAGE